MSDDGSTTATKYYSFDHLHSVTALSDELGRVATSGPDADVLGYDPWGARRNPDGTTVADPSSFNLKPGHREFTGHETIPNVGLINMNGRIYDPLLGRFLSPDPTVQFVANLQSYNRYTYVLNNPLRNTDPTGFYLATNPTDPGLALMGKVLNAVFTTALAALGTAACAYTAGSACGIAFGLLIAYWNSTVMVYQGASWGQAIAISGFGALAGYGAGQIVKAEGNSLISMAATGAASSTANKVFSTAVMGKSLGGLDLLEAAAQGAATSAFKWGIGSSNNVTKASASATQAGGQSGESIEEIRAREQAAGRAANEAQWTQGYGSSRPSGQVIADESDYIDGGKYTYYLYNPAINYMDEDGVPVAIPPYKGPSIISKIDTALWGRGGLAGAIKDTFFDGPPSAQTIDLVIQSVVHASIPNTGVGATVTQGLSASGLTVGSFTPDGSSHEPNYSSIQYGPIYVPPRH